MRPKGFLTLSGMSYNGKVISTQEAVDRGLIKPGCPAPRGWGIPRHEVPMGYNLFTDNGRQALVYAFGFRRPIKNYVCNQFGIGTGTTPPKTIDTTLVTPIAFYDDDLDTGTPNLTLKPITRASFPQPFIVDIEMTLATTEANGSTITEWGLYTGDGGGDDANLMLARNVTLGFLKTSAVSPSFVWRLRL